MADWVSIKAEYVSSDISTRAIADKHGVSYNTLRKHAEKEGWSKERGEHGRKVAAKVSQKVANIVAIHEVDRLTRILNVSDAVIARAEQAAQEITKHAVMQKTITEGMGVDSAGHVVKGRKTKTTIDVIDMGVVNVSSLKRLASALKDLHEIAKGNEQDGGKDIEDLTPLADLLGEPHE